MRLIKLTLRNFKGVEFFDFVPDGQSVTVCGTNGSGKTTLYDAYCWLLFGKDSAARADFDILPYDTDDALVSVTAELDIGAEGSVTLERSFSRKIVRQKGTDEPSIKSEYKFSIDGVPKNKTAYTAFIESICPAETLIMLSDPDYFAGKLEWKKRRSVLAELFGKVTDEELLRDEQWAMLRGALEGRTVEDFRAVSTAERKKIKAELDALPDRINEAEIAIPTAAPLDGDEERFNEIATEIKELMQRAAELSEDSVLADYRRQASELKAKIAEKKAEYLAGTSELNEEARKTMRKLTKRVTDAENELRQNENDRELLLHSIENHESTLTSLRAEYTRLNSITWDTGRETCPACGQSLPVERIADMRRDFNESKAAKIQQNVAYGLREKESLEARKTSLIKAEERISEAQAKLDAAKEEQRTAEHEFTDAPDFEATAEYKELSAEYEEIAKRGKIVSSEISERQSGLDDQIKQLREEQEDIAKRRTAAEVAERQRQRIGELKERGRELGKRAAQFDNLLDMAARFEQFRLTAIESSVNDRFKYAKFKLFDRQINGGYAECCEVVVDDAPYSTNLNPGKKINAGLDIIRTLGEAYGFSAPVWVDNAESYVHLMDIDSQVIALRVDGEAHTLTIMGGLVSE